MESIIGDIVVTESENEGGDSGGPASQAEAR
jgi:hypothetical protein